MPFRAFRLLSAALNTSPSRHIWQRLVVNREPVNDPHFLALMLPIALAYSWATIPGQQMKPLGVNQYAGRIQEHHDKTPRQRDFSFGLYDQRWLYTRELWADWACQRIALEPHKQLYFQRGDYALSLMQEAF